MKDSMKHPGRPIGAHIRAICAWLEDNGPATSGEIQRGTGILPQSLPPSCMRAVCFGLVQCEGTTRRTYTVAPGWQDRISSRDRPKLREVIKPPVLVTPKINSVWALGA